jgi:hypothetical protein
MAILPDGLNTRLDEAAAALMREQDEAGPKVAIEGLGHCEFSHRRG